MVGRLAGGLDALIGSIAVVKCAGLFLKSQGYQEAVSPAEESIDLVGLEQTEVKSLVDDWSRHRLQSKKQKHTMMVLGPGFQ